jgi:hypothetical protein
MSSINQQVNNSLKLHIKVASHISDPFKHELNKMLTTFPNLDLQINEYIDKRFNIRGETRTDNIKNCTSDWLLFLDGDNLFHPQFFNNLNTFLIEADITTKKKVISVPRLTMASKEGYKLVDNNTTDEVSDAYSKAVAVKTYPSFRMRTSGAGYFQLVHVPTMLLMGITKYVNRSYDTQILNKNIRFRTKSDIVFRKKFDGIHAITDLPPIIHLNHYRRTLDKEYDFDKCN